MNIQSLTIFRLLLVLVVLLIGGRSLRAQEPTIDRTVLKNEPKTFIVDKEIAFKEWERYEWFIIEWNETIDAQKLESPNVPWNWEDNEFKEHWEWLNSLNLLSDPSTQDDLQYTFKEEGIYFVQLYKRALYPVGFDEAEMVCMQEPKHMWIKVIKDNPSNFKFSDFYTLGFCEDKRKLHLSSNTSNPDCTWQWEPAEYFENPNVRDPYFIRHADFSPGDQVEITCKATHSSGISSIDTAYVNIEEQLEIQISYEDEYLYSENSHLIKVTANKSNVIAASVIWETVEKDIKSGTTALSDVSRYIIYEPGTYRCTVTDLSGCEVTTEVRFDSIFWRSPVAEDDFVIAKDRKQMVIDVLANDTDWNNNIDPSSLHITNNPAHGFVVLNEDNTVTYNLTKAYEQRDEFSYRICDFTDLCSTARVLIFFESSPINLPEGISPLNNDGINDKFVMIGINYFDKRQLVIFNRWGEKVYASDNYGAEEYGGDGWWNGEINSGIRKGQKVKEGTYYYILKLDSHSPIKGSITIR